MNQSDTNPLATALAALMTGHNANPNTSLRIPLVDSNGNLQPGPTLAELAAVLGARMISQPTLIGNGEDLDNVISNNFYYSDSAGMTQSLFHLPEGMTAAFILLNFKPYGSKAYMSQVIVYRQRMYIRFHEGLAGQNNWTAWKEFASL